MVFGILLASQILWLFWAQVLSNRINKISLKFPRCANQTYLYSSVFKEKSCFNYMPETPLSVIFFQTFIIFFFLSVTARNENNYNFGSIGHNSLIQTLNVLSSKKITSSKFSWCADHTLKIFLQEKFCFFMHHPEMILRCLTSSVEFWNKQ